MKYIASFVTPWRLRYQDTTKCKRRWTEQIMKEDTRGENYLIRTYRFPRNTVTITLLIMGNSVYQVFHSPAVICAELKQGKTVKQLIQKRRIKWIKNL